MTLFKDSHHIISLWWHSLKTDSTSAELWQRLTFDDTLWRQTALQQNFGSVWWHSLKTDSTSAELWQSLMTLFKDSHLWWQCLSQKNPSRSLSGKNSRSPNHLCFVLLCLVTGNGSRTFLSPIGFRFQFVCVWLCFLCPWFSTAWLSNTFQTSYADQLAPKQLRAKKKLSSNGFHWYQGLRNLQCHQDC